MNPERNTLQAQIAKYWESFYARDSGVPPSESDFARWVSQQIGSIDILVDFGCGTGRDSIWFAKSGAPHVIATDNAHAGLAAVRRRADDLGLPNLIVAQVDLNAPKSLAALKNSLAEVRATALTARETHLRTVFYARFLLHAIEETAQEALLKFCAAELRAGDWLALEYRATELNAGNYVFGDHYRRPVDPELIEKSCIALGFSSVESVVSDEFAVLGDERPLVARTLAAK